jgi:two-component system response regulator
MESNDKEKEIDLFYVEDNEDFIDFVNLAVKKLDAKLNYKYATDAIKAKEFLEQNAANGPHKKVKLILLDYNLPGMSGMQFLKYIRSSTATKHVPVVIFSSSDNPQDVKNAYLHGANAYIVKPVGMNNLKQTVQTVYDFWINKNQLSI